MIKRLFFVFLFSLFSLTLIAQLSVTDSLKAELKKANSDTIKCLIYASLVEAEANDLIWPQYNDLLYSLASKNLKTAKGGEIIFYSERLAEALNNKGYLSQLHGNTQEALKYYEQSLSIHLKNNRKSSAANCYNNIGAVYEWLGKFKEAQDYFFKGLEIYEELKDKGGIAFSYNNIATVLDNLGDISSALKAYHKCLDLYEQTDDKVGSAAALLNISIIYVNQGDLKKALEYQFRSLKLRRETDDLKGVSQCLFQIGGVYQDLGKLSEALKCFQESYSIQKQLGDKQGIAYNLINFGSIAREQKKYDEALSYFLQSLEVRKEIEDKLGIAASLVNIGQVYFLLNNFSKAEEYLLNGMKVSKDLGYPENIRNASLLLSDIYTKMGKFLPALENYKLFIKMRDSLNNMETQKTAIKLQAKYTYEKEKAISDKEHELKMQQQRQFSENERNRQNVIILFISLILITVAVFSFVFYKRYKLTQAQKKIIEDQEKQTSEQKKLIEIKHQEISDSINYAERIQRSFLASRELLNQTFKHYFIFFKPKEKVSGDFYWAAPLANGNFAFITADSTGHGVPGAIMSLLNITSLEKAVETQSTPHEILNLTRRIIIDRLKMDGSAEGGKDGMDASLMIFSPKSSALFYAAANNPIWIVRNHTLLELKADKMPVGKHDRDEHSFTPGEFNLLPGDVIYTFTDGMPDQFGGPDEKKFKIRQLKELLVSISSCTMDEQYLKINEAFYSWKGNLEQIDDVTVIGIRV
jgi:tetratricopeptide (TPR) repeat protein